MLHFRKGGACDGGLFAPRQERLQGIFQGLFLPFVIFDKLDAGQ